MRIQETRLRQLVIAIALSLTVVQSVMAENDDEVFSGPQTGERIPPLTVRNVFEDPAVELDPVANAKGGPLLLVFVHKRERPAFGLMRTLLQYSLTRKKDGLNTAAVFLTGDVTETSNWMRRIRNYFPKESSVTVSPEGIEGPGSFGLNRDVTVTVLVANEGRVTANFALVQPSLQADGPKIAKAIVDVLGGGEVPDLVKFSNQRMQQMRRDGGRNSSGRGPEQDSKLTGLLRRLIQKDASEEQVGVAAKELNAYLAKSEVAAKRVGEIANRIIDAGKLENYGTKAAQEHLKEWAKKFKPKTRDEAQADKASDDKEAANDSQTDKGGAEKRERSS